MTMKKSLLNKFLRNISKYFIDISQEMDSKIRNLPNLYGKI